MQLAFILSDRKTRESVFLLLGINRQLYRSFNLALYSYFNIEVRGQKDNE